MTTLHLPVFVLADPGGSHERHRRWEGASLSGDGPSHSQRTSSGPNFVLRRVQEGDFERALKLLPSFMAEGASLHMVARNVPRYRRRYGHLYYPAPESQGGVQAWAAAALTAQVVAHYLYAVGLPEGAFRTYYGQVRRRVADTVYKVSGKTYRLCDLELPVERESSAGSVGARRFHRSWLQGWLAAEFERCVQHAPLALDRVCAFAGVGAKGKAGEGATPFYFASGFYPWLLLHAAELLQQPSTLAVCQGCQQVIPRTRRNRQSCDDTCRKRAARVRARQQAKRSRDV